MENCTDMKFCQSCGMPLNDEHSEFLQKELDGSYSDYCTLCYKEGKFINQSISFDEMVEINVQFLTPKMGEDAAREMVVNQMKTLKRWS